ncbi:hypothetical protein GCM10017581_089700 [Dactylosporangium matsuzakiense]|uniref:Uncharacterized protein n=1 Tax=Dactylosporangium matsuzakiense TaxID=53360 RepID=A0A9W6KTX4_9ACTN|nr:hypothetical protein GCM10017581_089700 [Dactylosporangium matsuzakiense]
MQMRRRGQWLHEWDEPFIIALRRWPAGCHVHSCRIRWPGGAVVIPRLGVHAVEGVMDGGKRRGPASGGSGRWPAVVALALLLGFTVAALRWGGSLQSAVTAGLLLTAAAARLVPAGVRRRRRRQTSGGLPLRQKTPVPAPAESLVVVRSDRESR